MEMQMNGSRLVQYSCLANGRVFWSLTTHDEVVEPVKAEDGRESGERFLCKRPVGTERAGRTPARLRAT